MDDYLKLFRDMISLRGLTDHTILSYSTYIKAYLAYLSDILHKSPEKMFPGMSYAVLSVIFSIPEGFLTVPSTPAFHSCAFSPSMSCINPGIRLSFLCVSLILIFPTSLPRRKSASLFPHFLI